MKAIFSYDEACIVYNDGSKEEVHQGNVVVNPAGKAYWGSWHGRQIRQFYDAVEGVVPLDISGEEALKHTN